MSLPTTEAVAALRTKIEGHRAEWVAKKDVIEKEYREAKIHTITVVSGHTTDCWWYIDKFDNALTCLNVHERLRKDSLLSNSFWYDSAVRVMNEGLQGTNYVK